MLPWRLSHLLSPPTPAVPPGLHAAPGEGDRQVVAMWMLPVGPVPAIDKVIVARDDRFVKVNSYKETENSGCHCVAVYCDC